jgi:hypothetical protein
MREGRGRGDGVVGRGKETVWWGEERGKGKRERETVW